MAEIPTYEQRFLPEAKGASSYSLAGEKRSPLTVPRSKEQMWANIAKDAEALTNIGGKILVARDDSELQKLKVSLLEEDKALQGFMSSQEFKEKEHYDDYVPIHTEQYQKIKTSLLENFKGSSTAREKASLIIDEAEIQGRSWALGRAQQQETADMQTGLLDRLNTREALAIEAADGGYLPMVNRVIADTKEDLAAMTERGVITPIQAERMYEDFSNTTQYAVNVQRVDRAADLYNDENNPNAKNNAIGALRTLIEEYDKPATEEFLDRTRIQVKHYAESRLRALLQDKSTKDWVGTWELERDWGNSVAKGYETGEGIAGVHAKIDEVYGDQPDKAEMYHRKYDHEINIAQDAGKITSMVPKASAESIPVLRQGMEDMKNNMNYEDWSKAQAAFEQAVAKRQREIDADPAGYVVKTFEVEEPEKVMAIQAKIGVPEHERAVLTKRQSEAIVGNFGTSSGKEIVSTLTALQEKYGAYWGNAYRDLVKAKMPTALRIVATMDQPGQQEVRVKIAEVYKVDEKELLNSVAGIKNMSSEDIRNAVSNELNKHMAPVRKALINTYGFTSEGITQITDLADVLKRTSYAYMLENNNATKATKIVVADVIEKSFSFSDDENYMIPVQTNLTPGKVDDRLDSYLQKMELKDLRSTTETGKPIYRSKTEQMQALTNIKNKGYWANTPDLGGVMLLSPSGKIVHNEAGKPITMTWEDIGKYGVKAPAEIKPGKVNLPPTADALPDFRANKRSN